MNLICILLVFVVGSAKTNKLILQHDDQFRVGYHYVPSSMTNYDRTQTQTHDGYAPIAETNMVTRQPLQTYPVLEGNADSLAKSYELLQTTFDTTEAIEAEEEKKSTPEESKSKFGYTFYFYIQCILLVAFFTIITYCVAKKYKNSTIIVKTPVRKLTVEQIGPPLPPPPYITRASFTRY